MSKDKLLYSYLGAWNTNILEYSKLFPKSLILHKRKKAIINDGILYGGVGGIPVVFGNSTGTAGYWTGNSDDITEYYEGLSVIYVKGINGAATTYLNINNLGNIEVFKNNIKIGNEHSIGSPILLTYINGKWQTTDINTNDVNLTKETTITNSSYYLTFVQEKEGFQTTYTTSSLYYQGDTLYTTYISGKLKNNISLWGQDCDFSTNIDGDISDTGDILPKVDVSYNIGSGSLRYNNVYGQRFVGRADTVASSQDNTTKFYFVGVTGANQSLKFDNTIYTTNNTGNLFARRIYLGNTPPPENTTYNLYVTGKGYLSGELTSDKFITKNYDNSYVLLAGGNVKKIDSFGDGVYLPLIGGTLTGDIYYKDNNNTSYLYLNEKNSGLFVGGNGNLTSNVAVSTNGNVYLTLKTGNTYFKHNIVGGTGVSVTSDINGKISITNTLPHKLQHLYIGLVDINANGIATNPYLKLFDDTNISHQYQIKGSGSTTVTSDANGNITISSTDTNTDTHWTSYLRVGAKDATTTAATSNGATYLKLIENGSVRADQILIKGTGIVSVSSDSNGVITINGTAITNHYNTHLYIGAVDVNANAAATNPYIKLFDDTTLRHQYQIKAGNGISVDSDANGNLTITNTKPDINHDTHYTSGLYIGDKDTKANAATTNGNSWIKLFDNNTLRNQYNIVGSGIVTVTTDANGKITINGTAITNHYTTHLYVGAVDVNANAAATNPYIKLFDDTTLRHQYQIKGSGGTTISSDANGNITISSSTTSHTHQIKINNTTYTIPYTGSVDCGWYIEKLPWWTSGSGQNVNDITSGITFVYTNHNAPTNGTIAVFSSRNNTYQLQIQSSYNSRGNFYYRSKNGDNGTWLDWTRVIDAANYTSYIDYHLYIGAADANSSAAVSNPYIKLYNLSTKKYQYQVKGGTGITVASDSNGHITITNSAPNTDYRVTQNSDSANAEYRLLFKYSANDTNETTTVKYNTKFRYNPSTGNLFNNGNFYIDTADNDRFIQFRYNSNNYAGASWRLISRGSGSGDTNYFDIETGGSDSSANTWYRVIRLTMDNRYVGIGTDSPSSKLHVNGGTVQITNNSNTVNIGSLNSSYCHFQNSANIPFYFNKTVYVDGDIRLYSGNGYLLSTGQMYAKGYHFIGNDNNNYVLTAGGSYKQWTTSSTANAIVARDGNGYIFGSYFNSAISDENITIGSVYIRNTSDNYIRRISFANFMTQVNGADTVSFTKNLKVTQDWMDADIAITTTNFPKGNGCYAVLIDATSLGDATDLWSSIYSGVMTIYTSGTNATGSDEVILHRSGHASAKRLYIRTTQNNSGNYKLQIAASNDFSVGKNLVFKFRKLI